MKYSVTPDTTDIHSLLREASDGDLFEFAEGEYYLREPLQVTGKTNLCFRAAEGARVHLHAGVLIRDWQAEGEGLWTADVPAWSCELYASGVRQQLARWPKEAPASEAKHYASSVGTTPADARKRSFLIDSGAVPGLEDGSSLSAFLWPSGPQGEYNWHSVMLPCTLTGDRIDLDRDTWYDLGLGTRFYLLNHPSFLTDEGEFYIDRDQLKLFYRPVGGSPEGQQVILPMMTNLFEIRDSSGIVIEGLHLSSTDRVEFYDGEIFDQDEALVFITGNSGNITVRDCEISNAGLNGVCMYRHAQRVTVENCHIHDIGHTGVRAYGDWVSAEYMNRGHLIRNNHIHHMGARVGQCAGVQMLQSGENTIANNLIHHSSRYAISLLAPNTRTFVKPTFFPHDDEVPSFKAKWYTYVRDNLVYRNEVYACNLDSQDTGLIHGFRSGEGNVISDNIVRDSEIPFSFGNAIYLDDCCDGWTVKNNLAYNLNHHGKGKMMNVLTLKGIGNVAENNRFIRNNVEMCGVISTFSMGPKENYNLAVRKNILHENGAGLYNNTDWQERRFKEADCNLFSESAVPYHIRGGLGVEGDIPLYQWQREGFDSHSLTGNPRFMDEERDDFRLRYDSPAATLGIEEIDYGAIGLTREYRMEEAAAPLVRLFPRIRLGGQEISGGRSWVSVRSGDVLSFSWQGRSQGLFLREGLEPDVCLMEGEPGGLELTAGGAKVLKPGVYRLLAELDDARCCIDLLVDEEVEDLSWALIPDRVVQGERHPVSVVAKTVYGRSFLVEDADLHAGSGVEVIGDQVYFLSPGSRTVSVSYGGTEKELVTEVCPDLVRDVVPKTAKIARVGVPQPVTVMAKMKSGRVVEVECDSIEGEDLMYAGGMLTLNRIGEQKLTFWFQGVMSVMYVRALENLPVPEGYSLSQYGPEEGTAVLGQDGMLELYSTANNVWWKEDDATFLKQEMESEGLKAEIAVHSIEGTHRFAQNGILIRAEDTPESRCVHFRVNTEGEVMVAVRNENRALMNMVMGASPWAEFGGGDAEVDDRVAEGVAFPVHLRVTYRQGFFSFFFQKGGEWERLTETPLQMPERCWVGAAAFSVDNAHVGRTRFALSLTTD